MGGIKRRTRAQVLRRDAYSCRRCGSTGELTLHHVIPRRRGGGDSEDNLVVLCEPCHLLWHRWEGNKVGFEFFEWLAGGERRKRASHRSRLIREITTLRFTGSSYSEVAQSLNAQVLTTPGGKLWTPDNVRKWVERSTAYPCYRRSWRLVQWPYFAEPVVADGTTWRWRALDQPVGLGFRGRCRTHSLRYDFVHCLTRSWTTSMKGFMKPGKGILIFRTDHSLKGSKAFPLSVPPGYCSTRLLARRGNQVRRVVRRGPDRFAFIGNRFQLPPDWGNKDDWVWEDWESVDRLFVRLSLEIPGWLARV
jgi:hypothetical protein